MGMLACYMEAAGSLIDKWKTKSAQEIFEEIEALESEGGAAVYDMDKLWDGLHFLLTGVSAAEPIEGNLLSEAVVGTGLFSGEEPSDFITYIYPERAAEISAALDAFDIGEALAGFAPAQLAQNNVYPTIWLQEDRDVLAEDLRDAFEGLKEFYTAMREKKAGVIVSIY